MPRLVQRAYRAEMGFDDEDLMPPEWRIAVGYCPSEIRPRFANALALDYRLSQIVVRTSEPMLGQMRLAWWRDMLGQAPATRPKGDAVLDAISHIWGDETAPLISLVDGWEHILVQPPLPQDAAHAFAQGRIDALLHAIGPALQSACVQAVRDAAGIWALADLAAKVSDPGERTMLVQLGLAMAQHQRDRLPPSARGLAVLRALGLRGLKAGGAPLMEGRSAALIAFRAAIIGR